ncbi:MAG: hypothetical protein AB1796_12620, partial [Bacillota bacterium]
MAYKEADDARRAEPREARKKAEQMAFLYDFSRTVLGAQWCVLHLLDEETGELALKASLGMSAALQERAGRVRPEGSLLDEVLR